MESSAASAVTCIFAVSIVQEQPLMTSLTKPCLYIIYKADVSKTAQREGQWTDVVTNNNKRPKERKKTRLVMAIQNVGTPCTSGKYACSKASSGCQLLARFLLHPWQMAMNRTYILTSTFIAVSTTVTTMLPRDGPSQVRYRIYEGLKPEQRGKNWNRGPLPKADAAWCQSSVLAFSKH